MEHVIENGRRQGQKAVNQANDLVKEATGKNLINQAQQWYGTAEHFVTDVAHRSSSFAKRYPLQALLGAAAFGYIFAALCRGRKA